MQVCYNCGRFFEDDEIVQCRDGETALHIYCCPYCGVDDIGEAATCLMCDQNFHEDEVHEGFCLKCLWNEIDYDVALAYMKHGAGWLASFIAEQVYGASIEHTSKEFDALMEEVFLRKVADEKLRLATSKVERAEFLDECRLFCLPYYYAGEFGCDGARFAEWYAEYRKERAKG